MTLVQRRGNTGVRCQHRWAGNEVAREGWPPGFRRRIVALVEAGRKVAEVAVEFEVSEQTIYTWRRQSRIDSGLEAGVTTSEHSELTAAKHRIRELETELAIHRRATELLTETTGPKGLARSPKGERDCSTGRPPKGSASAPQGAHRKRPSGRDWVEGHLAGRPRPAGGTRTVERPLVPTESASRGRDRRTGNTPRGRKLPRGFSRPEPFRPFDYTLRHGMARRFIE